jgi:tRNA 2-thiocytidine biosynthesis protein TtcA
MPAKLVTEDEAHVVIRPLLYAAERDIAAFAAEQAFPILPCNLCGSQENLWRKQIKQLLDELEQRIPQVRDSLLASLMHVRPTHLMDTKLLEALGAPIARAAEGEAGPTHLVGKRLPLVT